MKISLKKLALFLIILSVSTFVFSTVGQKITMSATDPDDFGDRYFSTTTNAECADYYKFNGVKVDFSPDIVQSVSGSPMGFSGSVLNQNEYPIVDGKVYAKIFRNRKVQDNNGPDVLDSFVVRDGINLKPGEKQPIFYKWNIPAYVIGGDYRIVTYFVSSNKFNLAGLSFTDDVIGSVSNFSVKSQQTTGVMFKKDGVKVNKKPYYVVAYSPVESATDPVLTTFSVLNSTKERKAVKVEFNVYKWDNQAIENKIDTITQIAIIEAGKTAVLPVVVRDNNFSVYYVEAVLNYKDTKSISVARFVRDGVSMPRINFPSITSYPLVSGQKNKIFSCFHNASNSNLPVDGKLKMEILGEDNNTIMSYEYSGEIKGEMSAVVQEFTPRATYKKFKLHATLFSGSKIVDEVYIPYDCNVIDPDKCSVFKLSDLISNKWFKMTLNILGILILLFILYFITFKHDKIKSFLLRLMKNKIRILIVLIALVSVFSVHSSAKAMYISGSGSDSGSSASGIDPVLGSDSGPAVGCFEVINMTPISSNNCTKNNCSPKTVSVLVNGVRLLQVKKIRIGTLPVNITFQNDSQMIINFEKQTGSGIRPMVFRDNIISILSTCSATTPFTFQCLDPDIKDGAHPLSGPTTGGTDITVSGLNFNNIQSVYVGNALVRNIKSRTDTSMTFVSPANTEGWKDIGVKSVCWDHNIDKAIKAFEYQKDPRQPAPPVSSSSFWNWDRAWNYSAAVTFPTPNPALYYWASDTGSMSNGKWAQALGSNVATINYASYATDDYGITIQNGDDVLVGKNIHFNFDKTNAATSISWSGVGYTEDTPYGSWVEDADYPATSSVCTSKNYVESKTYLNTSTGVTENIGIYIPLSVSPPNGTLSFTSGSVDPYAINENDFPSWGAPPVPDNDSSNWECDSENGGTCVPTVAGYKTAHIYYAPTFGNYYYGWKGANGVCKTNSVPLHEKTTMNVNNASQYPVGTNSGMPTCTPGNSGCINVIKSVDPVGNIVGCPSSYPFYNRDKLSCYSTFNNFINSYHSDPNVLGSNVPTDYYSPYQLRFRESVYSLGLNVIPATGNITPSAPIVEGPNNVIVGTNYTYTAHSDTGPVVKKKNESFFASVMFAIKKVFAQTSEDRVEYLFDWNSDGNVDSFSGNIPYSDFASASHIWSEATTTPLRVAAKDMKSGNLSEWTVFPITAKVATTTGSIEAPSLSGEYCTDSATGVMKGTISWNSVTDAAGYNLYNSSNPDVPISNTDASLTQFPISPFDKNSGVSYYVYAYKIVDSEYIPSEKSNVVAQSSFADAGSCNPSTSVGPTIDSKGFKFYSNPSWASSTDDKCNFYGYASSTITDSLGVVYNDVAVQSCYVDSGISVIVSSIPSFIIRSSLGKHKLYCDLTYDGGTGPDGNPLTATMSVSTEGKCSKVPKVIEK